MLKMFQQELLLYVTKSIAITRTPFLTSSEVYSYRSVCQLISELQEDPNGIGADGDVPIIDKGLLALFYQLQATLLEYTERMNAIRALCVKAHFQKRTVTSIIIFISDPSTYLPPSAAVQDTSKVT